MGLPVAHPQKFIHENFSIRQIFDNLLNFISLKIRSPMVHVAMMMQHIMFYRIVTRHEQTGLCTQNTCIHIMVHISFTV